jgi:DNA-binding transcriptional MerR regulator
MASKPLTVAGLAGASGLSVDDVRFYRERGLLQPPKRARSRTDDFVFGSEHVERLKFIRRALACGLTHNDVGRMVDPRGLLTCGDVYKIASFRLEHLRKAGRGATLAARYLAEVLELCPGVGPGKDCRILRELARPGC